MREMTSVKDGRCVEGNDSVGLISYYENDWSVERVNVF